MLSPGTPGITLMRDGCVESYRNNPDFGVLVLSCDLPPAKKHPYNRLGGGLAILAKGRDESTTPVSAHWLTEF